MSIETDKSTILLFEALANQVGSDERVRKGVRDTYVSLLSMICLAYLEAIADSGADVEQAVAAVVQAAVAAPGSMN